jgi:PAS domain S-box-containing protein
VNIIAKPIPKERNEGRWLPSRGTAWRTSLVYALLGGLWILFSGWLVHRFVQDRDQAALLEDIKGWVFVSVTAAMLGVLLNKVFKEVRHSARQLRENEQRWHLALEGAGLGVWDWNVQTNQVFYSAQWKAILGFDVQELGTDFSEWESRIHPEDQTSFRSALQNHLESRTRHYVSEYRVRCKDGTYKWILDQGQVMGRTEDGKPLRVVGTRSDITGRKRAEEALLTGERLLHTVIDLVPHFIFAKDGEGRYLFVNRACADAFDLTPEKMVGMRDQDFLPSEADAAKFMEDDRGVIESGEVKRIPQEHFTRRDGQVRILQTIKVPFAAPVGGAALMGVAVDVTELKAAEAELRQSETEFRTTFEVASIGMAQADPKTGRLLRVNQRTCAITGYSRDDLLRMSVQDLTHPEDRQRDWDLFQSVVRGEAPDYHIEKRYVRKDGTIAWVKVTMAISRATAGQPERTIATIEDITERRRLEAFRQALLTLGSMLNRTRDRLSAGRALLAAADQLWKWDAATLDLVQPGTGKVQPVLLVDIIAGEKREVLDSGPLTTATPHMRRVMENGAELVLRDEQFEGANSVRFGDCSRLSASIMYVPVRCERETVGILSIQSYTPRTYSSEDLRILQALADYCGGALDRIQAEQALQQSEERYRGLVETIGDWIWEVDTQGRYTYSSPQVQTLLGYAPAEVVGRVWFDLVVEEESELTRAAFREAASKRQPLSGHASSNHCRDGRLVVLESSAVPVVGPGDELCGYRGITRDITERKQLEAQLRQAQKLEAIGQLAGGVAHDFNNILAAVMMHLDLLRTNPALGPETRQGLEDLNAEIHRAANLTRQLLMFSRRSVLVVRPLDLNDIVENMLKMLSRMIGENIDLQFERETELPLIAADVGMMEQILMNLVVNSRDAMPKGGRITISTSSKEWDTSSGPADLTQPSGRFLCLTVSDSGCGMDEVTLKRVFEPFFTTKEPGKGTGLGLATVHGIVAQHKGWVEVDSEPGLGTTFRVFLPALSQAQQRKEVVQPPEPLQTGEETVLLVEDETAVRQLVARSLRALGYRVHEAQNGQQAMVLWQEHGSHVDMLFTDMVMPEGMTGLELAEQLQALKPGLKTIISSGYSQEITQAGVHSQRGIVYLPKPYEVSVLASVVRKVLDGEPPASVIKDPEQTVG